jgi:glycosyltransferase involved in cell wall biosynthesis
MPRVTIVTICFNNPEELAKTCLSVDGQTTRPFEHWIIDGSTNKSIAEWLNSTPQPAYRKWICEPDNGIADAFNKGILKAKGDVIQLLNSGDIYAESSVLGNVSDFFQKDPGIQWMTGKIWVQRLGQRVLIGKPFDPDKVYRGMRSVAHPTWFVRKSVYEEVGLYDPKYGIAMDYDMMCRLVNYRSGFINIPLVIFDEHGVSNQHYLKALLETRMSYVSHFGFSIKMELWHLRLKILHLIGSSAFGKFLYRIKVKVGMENI